MLNYSSHTYATESLQSRTKTKTELIDELNLKNIELELELTLGSSWFSLHMFLVTFLQIQLNVIRFKHVY